MKKSEFRTLLHMMAEAWSRKDHVSVLKVFADNVHYSDPLRYRFQNLKELKEFFDSSEMPEQHCEIHATIFDEDQQLGAAEYSYKGENLYHGLVLIKLENDKIALWREYQHMLNQDWDDFVAGPNG